MIGVTTPEAFRNDLLRVAPPERDTWLDRAFGLDDIPADGPALPRGCVPYLPTPVSTLLRMIELAGIAADDVFVDIGAGLGRAAMLTHCLTGAKAIGLEIQPQLVRGARDLVARLGATRVSVVEGDATEQASSLESGTVFFLYCPFSGLRLERLLDELESIARARPIRVCTVDLPLPERAWLAPIAVDVNLRIFRSIA